MRKEISCSRTAAMTKRGETSEDEAATDMNNMLPELSKANYLRLRSPASNNQHPCCRLTVRI